MLALGPLPPLIPVHDSHLEYLLLEPLHACLVQHINHCSELLDIAGEGSAEPVFLELFLSHVVEWPQLSACLVEIGP